MTELLRFEWLRMRSLRATWGLFGVMVAFALVADLAALGRRLDGEGLAFHLVQRDIAVRWLVAAAIGAQALGHDFRYGTIRPTLLAFPRRGRLLAGKALAAALAGATGALVASAASLALLGVLADWDASVLADPRLWRSVALGVVSVALVATLAVGLAALTRGSGPPVVVIALWAGVLEPAAVVALGGGAANLLPFLSLFRVTAYADPLDLGSPGPLAAAVFPLYLAAMLTAAGVALARRDAITD